ncbi:MAG: DNA polymerase IV [Deltaproteobacteria bacterium]|nr:DNA polymerase IV [Deltaproteobacteria bacterium]
MTEDLKNPEDLTLPCYALYPQAIVHVDADAFFASVEQAVNPKLKGRPVVCGAERGIVVALSYEAKKYGISRGMLMGQARRLCPGLVIAASDYETYGLFSKRMFEILRRFTPQVEEYSIDEAFADLSGLRRLYRSSYPQIATAIKNTIEKDLGITVSLGLSLTKGLAKLASKHNKPSGLVMLPGRELAAFLKKTTIDKVWGFGKNSTAVLNKYGVHTVFDFITRPHAFAKKLFGKIGSELWRELSGHMVYPVNSREKTTCQSISKFKTFAPPTKDPEFLFGQLLRNLEGALSKLHRYKLSCQRVVITLRSQGFTDNTLEITLSRRCTAALDMVNPVKEHCHGCGSLRSQIRIRSPTQYFRRPRAHD